jgi:high-affinity nickel-transport protein
MSGTALISLVAALGMRHGVDPDHLSIIDGLSRFHPSRWNGVLFGMGFETASQLSAILLAGQLNPWALGLFFTLGMMLVDGTDGILVARTQQLARAGYTRSVQSSRALGLLVVIVSFTLAGAEFGRVDLDRVALPLGLILFASVVCLRLRSGGGRTRVLPAAGQSVQTGNP